jgi:hypothetical protein
MNIKSSNLSIMYGHMYPGTLHVESQWSPPTPSQISMQDTNYEESQPKVTSTFLEIFFVAIVLYVLLRYMDSGYPFGIFKLF